MSTTGPDGPLLSRREGRGLHLTLNRPAARNALSRELLTALRDAVAAAEADPEVRYVVLRGQLGVFCTGLDFNEIAGAGPNFVLGPAGALDPFAELLKSMAAGRNYYVAVIDGEVNAGGVGIASACDFVVATPRASFALSEALFGLLPANVIPYLIRRVGFQKAYFLTLSTQKIGAEQAAAMGLVDVLTNNPDEAVRRLMLRAQCVAPVTVERAKAYFRRMWLLTDATEHAASAEIAALLADAPTLDRIQAFVRDGTAPWSNPNENR